MGFGAWEVKEYVKREKPKDKDEDEWNRVGEVNGEKLRVGLGMSAGSRNATVLAAVLPTDTDYDHSARFLRSAN